MLKKEKLKYEVTVTYENDFICTKVNAPKPDPVRIADPLSIK